MKTSSDSFDSAGDSEALLGREASGTRRAVAVGINKCNAALWLSATFLMGVVAGLSAVYFLSRPTYNQCVESTTRASMLIHLGPKTSPLIDHSTPSTGPDD
jgi:hypothetical protein